MNYLIKNAAAIATCEVVTAEVTASYSTPSHKQYTDLRIGNGFITELGNALVPEAGEQVMDAKDCVVYPGFINSHHHLAQSVLKGIPEGLNHGLADWLASVPYRFWPHFTPELMYCAATLGLAELMRSGTTTCADHHYLYHASTTPELEDALWQAADDLGIRLVLCRGGATHRGTHKGLAKAGIAPETIEQMLKRLEHSYSRYHQANENAMRQLVVAPTSLIHSALPDDLKQLAQFARKHSLKLHSHLLEVDFDQLQALQKYNMSAVEFAQSCEWLGEDVWFAHLVKASPNDIKTLAQTKTGIAHCPTSNCRLGSGIAPVIAMEQQGMPITVGVDGSASSESASMIQELNLAWLIHRAQHGPNATTLNTILDWGSKNPAQLLGLKTTGEIAVGKAADIAIYDLADYRYWGVHSTAWAPLLNGEPVKLKASFIAGKQVMDNGEIIGLDLLQLKKNLTHELEQLAQKI